MGVPLFACFVSKWKIAEAAITAHGFLPTLAVIVLLLSALLTAAYMLTVVVRAFAPLPESGEALERLKDVHDPNWLMLVPLIVFSISIVVIGIYPMPLLHLFERIAAWEW